MSKGNSNFKSKKSHTFKPYDVSQSFVAKVASHVSGLFPQQTWLNRWLSPAESNLHSEGGTILPPHVSSTPTVNLHTNTDHGPGPAKRPRLPLDSPAYLHNKFLDNTSVQADEEISPIVSAAIPNDAAVAGPSGLCQYNRRGSLTPVSTGTSEQPLKKAKLEEKLTAATQRVAAATVDKINGDDCSETSESTSGCSSLVPQAQTSQNRRNESRHFNLSGSRGSTSILDRSSLFPGRSSTKVDLTSLQRRRPSFDVVAFTTPSKLSQISSSPRQVSSPFYSGRTMYGGASAYNTSSAGLFTPRRAGVTVRPVNANMPTEPALSSTAKKILDALEQFSTPVVDAKRLPVTPGAKRKLERYAELNVPTTTDLLRVKRRERLQKSTSAARQASFSSSQQTPQSSEKSESEYRIRSEADEVEKHTGKMTRKWKDDEEEPANKVNLPAAVLPVKTLPKIDIPLPPCPKPSPAGTSLLSTSATQSTTKSSNVCGIVSNVRKPLTMTPKQEFNFSPPVPLKSDVNSRTSLSTEQFNFVFSEPIGKNSLNSSGFSSTNSSKSKDSGSNLFPFLNKVSDNSNVGAKSSLGKNVKSNNKSVRFSTDVENTTVNTTTTVVSSNITPTITSSISSSSPNSDSKKTSSPDNNYWKCSMCMIKNSNDKNICIACDAKKTNTKSPKSSSPLIFKAPSDTWECKQCYVRNNNSLNKCAACASSKVLSTSTMVSSPVLVVSTTPAAVSVTTPSTITVTSGFGDKFKPPSDTWECKECFVRNKNASNRCISCESVKPGSNVSTEKPVVDKPASSGFGAMFKKPEGSWECDSCMIRNDSKATMCVACETPKPGAENNPKSISSSNISCSITTSGFKFGISNATPSSTPGFTLPSSFGGSSSDKKEEVKTGFQFGSLKSGSTITESPNFTFGIPSTKPTIKVNDTENSPKENKNSTNDKLPNPIQELDFNKFRPKVQEKSINARPVYKFGVAPVNHKPDDKKPSVKESSDSSFGSVLTPNLNEAKKVNDNKVAVNSDLFTFGASSSSTEKTDNNNKTISNFNFTSKPDQSVSTTNQNTIFGSGLTNSNQPEVKTTSCEPFTFGSGTSSSAAFSAKPISNSLFVFGSGSTGNENKAIPAFGSTDTNSNQKQAPSVSETKSLFGSSKEVTSIFGNAKPSGPMFGGNLVNDSKSIVSNALTNSTNVPAFGTSANSNTSNGSSLQGGFKTEPSSSIPSFLPFGTNAPSSPFQNQSGSQPQQQDKLLFPINSASGLQTPAVTTQSTGFSFGTSTPIGNEQAKPVFGFSAQTPSSGFSFTPAAPTPAQNFGFAPKEAEPASAFSFTQVQNSQPSPAPAFGVQNATPGFGSTSSNNLFTFGAQSVQQSQPSSSTPVFRFNSSQGTSSTPTNAFVFGSANTEVTQPIAAIAATTQPSVPAFDPNARPTFNFSGGSTPSFTATPNVVQRPIKKAIRRNPLR